MTLKEANNIAQEYIKKNIPGFVLMSERTIETDHCFVFFHQTLEFIKSGDFEKHAAIGYGPLIIGKKDGRTYQMGSGTSVKEALDSFAIHGNPFYVRNWSQIFISKDKGIELKESIELIELIKLLRRFFPVGINETRELIQKLNSEEKLQLLETPKESVIMELEKNGITKEYPMILNKLYENDANNM